MNYSGLMNIISLGAGVQSSTMALMASKGIIKPMPIGAIFADTFAEPLVVYEWLDWLESQLSFPVYRVAHHGTPLEDAVLMGTMPNAKRNIPIPVHTVSDDGGRGITKRQCTRDYKIRPIERKAKELMGHKKHARLPQEPKVAQWIGISSDEIVRAKESREKWTVHRFPLAFELNMSRQDCIDWMLMEGYPEPPKSACYFCPYHDKDGWARIKKDSYEWGRAVKLDNAIRNSGGMRWKLYLSSTCKPLEDVDFEDGSQAGIQLDLFMDECDGMCGV